MEYVTVFAQKVLFRRNGVGGVSQQQPCEIEDIMAVDEQLVIVPMGMEMITMMGLGEGSSNVAKMRKARARESTSEEQLCWCMVLVHGAAGAAWCRCVLAHMR